MKIALLGQGKMGKLLESHAKNHGCDVVKASRAEQLDLSNVDACIDFSHASQVPIIVERCISLNIPLIIGTTGWADCFDAVEASVIKSGSGCVYSSNFSVGIFLLEHLLNTFSSVLNKVSEVPYERAIHEIHHSKKVDAPSGTALQLAKCLSSQKVDISSTRCGSVVGTHTVYFEGLDDSIEIKHTAKNRNCFVSGAFLAAEWIQGKQGFYTFHQLLKDVYGI